MSYLGEGFLWLNAHGYSVDQINHVMSGKSGFESTRNPMYPIEVFIYAWKAGLEPPPWVMEYFGQAFDSYFSGDGSDSIDKLLGLAPGRGQDRPFKKYFDSMIESDLMWEIWRLRNVIGLPLDVACDLVEARLDHLDWSLMYWTRPAWANSRGMYRRWSESPVAKTLRDDAGDLAEQARGSFDVIKRAILDGYPRDALPRELRKQFYPRTAPLK